MSMRQFFSTLAVLGVAACESPQPVAPDLIGGGELASTSSQTVVGHANGEGVANVGVPMDFVFNALLSADGSAKGEGYHHALLNGNVIEFRTRVTCVSIDPVNNRAWVGGVITENNSTDPARMQPRNQVGRDIWWRVVDYGDGQSGVVDRTTSSGSPRREHSARRPSTARAPLAGPGDTPPQPQDAGQIRCSPATSL